MRRPWTAGDDGETRASTDRTSRQGHGESTNGRLRPPRAGGRARPYKYIRAYNHRFGGGAHCQGRPPANRGPSFAVRAHHRFPLITLRRRWVAVMGGGGAAAIDAKRTGAVRPEVFVDAASPSDRFGWPTDVAASWFFGRVPSLHDVYYQPFRLLHRNFRTSSPSSGRENVQCRFPRYMQRLRKILFFPRKGFFNIFTRYYTFLNQLNPTSNCNGIPPILH